MSKNADDARRLGAAPTGTEALDVCGCGHLRFRHTELDVASGDLGCPVCDDCPAFELSAVYGQMVAARAQDGASAPTGATGDAGAASDPADGAAAESGAQGDQCACGCLRVRHSTTGCADCDGACPGFSYPEPVDAEPSTMQPDDVPAELVEPLRTFIAKHWHMVYLGETGPECRDCDADRARIREMLAAVIPAIRAQVADEIEAAEAKIDRRSSDQTSWHCNGMIHAANIVRGGA